MREEGDLVGNGAREVREGLANVWRVIVGFVRVL
jgi:hypothetical protein